jgi:uncharacterized membrane protein (UPF0127 family)
MNESWARRIAAVAVLSIAAIAGAQEGPQTLPQIRHTAGIHVINAQLATTPLEREVGLMHRPAMEPNDGMLFVFEQPGQQCFWMKNTLIPLSVAFLADDGSVVNVDEMQAETLDGHCSAKPVRYVLEMNKGWFAKRGIKPGSKLRGPPFAH